MKQHTYASFFFFIAGWGVRGLVIRPNGKVVLIFIPESFVANTTLRSSLLWHIMSDRVDTRDIVWSLVFHSLLLSE